MMPRTGTVSAYLKSREKPLFPLSPSYEPTERGKAAEASARYKADYFDFLQTRGVNTESQKELEAHLVHATEDLATPYAFNKEENGVLFPSGERAKYKPARPKTGGHVRGGVLVGLPQEPQAPSEHTRQTIVVNRLTGVREVHNPPCPQFTAPERPSVQALDKSRERWLSRRSSGGSQMPKRPNTAAPTLGGRSRLAPSLKRWSSENLGSDVEVGESFKGLFKTETPSAVSSVRSTPRKSSGNAGGRGVSMMNMVQVHEISRPGSRMESNFTQYSDGANSSEHSDTMEDATAQGNAELNRIPMGSGSGSPRSEGNEKEEALPGAESKHQDSVVIQVALQQAKKNVSMKVTETGSIREAGSGKPELVIGGQQGAKSSLPRRRFLSESGRPSMSTLTDVSLIPLCDRRSRISSQVGQDVDCRTARPSDYPEVPVLNGGRRRTASAGATRSISPGLSGDNRRSNMWSSVGRPSTLSLADSTGDELGQFRTQRSSAGSVQVGA